MSKADFKILFVDDDISYARVWIERAYDDYGIELDHYEDWESAVTHFKGNPEDYQAMIIDAKGKRTHDDSSEKMSHIIYALREIKEMEGHGIYIPYVINTGYIEDSVIESIEEVKIFSKGKEDEMFSYLIEVMKSLPEEKVRKKHEDTLSIFNEDYLPINLRNTMISLLMFAENPTWRDVPEDLFNPLRKVMEAMFHKLIDSRCIDENCLSDKKINMGACIKYLNGETARNGTKTFTGSRVTPPHIHHSLSYIYDMTGTFSHEYLHGNDVSHYSLQSVVSALCEVLFWYRNFMESNDKNRT